MYRFFWGSVYITYKAELLYTGSKPGLLFKVNTRQIYENDLNAK